MKTPIIKKQIIKIFQKHGLSKDHATISSNALINAELVGAYGHVYLDLRCIVIEFQKN